MSTTTREQLLAHAQTLIRQRGYNGFSYRDLADQVGIKTSSIHYYFPSKDDLLAEAIDNYAEQTASKLQGIDQTLPACERLNRYAGLLHGSPTDQICLCGMLAADFSSLTDRARQAVQSFYRTHESWLSKVVADGQRDGTLARSEDPAAAGRYLFSAFQGALMSSRLFQTSDRIQDVVASMKASPGPI
ncbi:TetR/AcrR family transcriptional regulator [Pollutimonas harenae]|uniref:TetR/AcrR family transcriptional regulator n=1 Tax=Pollutimonas harenae TaxID=657015 RepID=A0A853GST0_9BURK|nr:TetR/AcrR family transcriptional regulator [Pollutimonas harenae]NYT85217.1 TetR/AcrR family transcriptional regulator [Pollutimonas harenae]TEA72412.1 TetR/AcrR family transcriptional regulator [Pollutimonas harenae]